MTSLLGSGLAPAIQFHAKLEVSVRIEALRICGELCHCMFLPFFRACQTAIWPAICCSQRQRLF
jgi:hypothetical protein